MEKINQAFDHTAAKWGIGAALITGGVLIAAGIFGHSWQVIVAGSVVEATGLLGLIFKIYRTCTQEQPKEVSTELTSDLRQVDTSKTVARCGYTPAPGTNLSMRYRSLANHIDFGKVGHQDEAGKYHSDVRVTSDFDSTFNRGNEFL